MMRLHIQYPWEKKREKKVTQNTYLIIFTVCGKKSRFNYTNLCNQRGENNRKKSFKILLFGAMVCQFFSNLLVCTIGKNWFFQKTVHFYVGKLNTKYDQFSHA